MNYMEIIPMEFNNGKLTGMSLFVSGCPFHCKNCFNPDAWDFEAGQPFTEDTVTDFLRLAARPYIKRITIVGGEPLCDENVAQVADLIAMVRVMRPDIKIWVYTGYTYETIKDKDKKDETKYNKLRYLILKAIDVLVDGPYIDELYDELLPFRGSSNQRLIDVPKTLETNDIVVLEIDSKDHIVYKGEIKYE